MKETEMKQKKQTIYCELSHIEKKVERHCIDCDAYSVLCHSFYIEISLWCCLLGTIAVRRRNTHMSHAETMLPSILYGPRMNMTLDCN